jgi:stress response protein SCP2
MNIMQKDQKFNLSQSIPNLSKLLVGLGWKLLKSIVIQVQKS